MWSSWVKEKGTTQVMYIPMLKDGPKRVNKIFSMIFSKYRLPILFLETLVAFSFFHAPSLEDLGVLIIFEEKITSSKTSFQMASIY
jgi:hypothetical protein